MDKHIIGENAGKLWRLLSTDAPRKWTLQEVKDATKFNDLMKPHSPPGGSHVRTKSNSNLNTTALRIRTSFYTLC